jgi:histidine triad (HIT) family protein
MASIFTRIIQGEIPSYKVAEDEDHLAFLDIRPLRKGHTLVIPKLEVDHLFDLPEELHSNLWKFARKVGRAVHSSMPGERVASVVLGMEVPHAHIHLIPINKESDIRFDRQALQFSEEEFQEIAASIALAFAKEP